MAGSRMRPKRFHWIMALGLTLLGAGSLILLFKPSYTWPHLLGAWLISINVVTFAYYGHDKSRATKSGNRVPEVVLHGLALLGGSLGAYAGMNAFRHKTVKGSFRIVFWFIVLIQLLLVIAIVFRMVRP